MAFARGICACGYSSGKRDSAASNGLCATCQPLRSDGPHSCQGLHSRSSAAGVLAVGHESRARSGSRSGTCCQNRHTSGNINPRDPMKIIVNEQALEVDATSDTPLLWVLRDHLGMTGTKFGCGRALCGACTVHVDGVPVRSCVLPLSALEGKTVTTIEGVAHGRSGALVQQAWIELDVPQCGYCQSGQIMSALALLQSNSAPSDADIDAAMSGNICRCGT